MPQNRIPFAVASDSEVFVLGTDANLWLDHAPFGNVPPTRHQVDANVAAFQALSDSEVFVLGTDANLWLEHAPFGNVPPTRQQVDANVAKFQALNDSEVFVLGTDANLWLEHAPFGNVPPTRQQVDANVAAFQALSDSEVLVLGTDANLWLEHAPFGNVPPTRQQVDANVAAFQALSFNEAFTGQILVLGTDGNLWLEHAPFGNVPPTRQQVDANVAAFQGLFDEEIFVLGTDGNLWLEHAPFGNVPPTRHQVDANVAAFQGLYDAEIFVLGTDGNLWLEHAPFGNVPPRREQVDANVWVFQSTAGVPAAPTNLHFINLVFGDESDGLPNVVLGWTGNSPGANSYVVNYSATRPGQPDIPPQQQTGGPDGGIVPNTRSGYTYTISARALILGFIGDGEEQIYSAPSNTITVTIPIVPISQVVTISLERQQIVEGPVPYLGQYPPAIGTVPSGNLLQIALPPSDLVLALNFVKSGHSTEECGDTNAVVTITQGNHTTADQLDAIYGVAKPPYSSTSPVAFLACLDAPENSPLIDLVPIQLTISFYE